MNDLDRRAHWENIYVTKDMKEVSWYQAVPSTSLDLIQQANLPKNAKIIDIGGGDSYLVDHLLELGYTDVTVLDISNTALERAKLRLGEKAKQVTWITADASTFSPIVQYDLWHDRAAFHFLTRKEDIDHYIRAAQNGIKPGGVLVMGTFSEQGPKKCSGIEIKQYTEDSLTDLLSGAFQEIKCFTVDHRTPFDTVQNFVFCTFKRVPA